MVRGRAGATGGPFNLGEMTVTRCALRLRPAKSGTPICRARRKDADGRGPGRCADADRMRPRLRAGVLILPLKPRTPAGTARAAKAAATKVDFFTMMRGED